jgi:serine/threonine protein kinase/tetratricopeptide (TPR) repeat protein
MPRLTPGTQLGSYEIVAPLGAGGMGEVYRARDRRLEREVALKVLPEAVASHEDRLARFEREAKTIAALNHPHIVTIHSIEEAGGIRFLTMELIEGLSLDQMIASGALPLARVLDVAIALADALSAAHEKGIVHRDLKPGNVMVTRDGRAKVLDFGLAKAAQSEPALAATQALTMAAPISTAGQVMGTVPYMAPEQVRGETVDARADLFSFGILLYEMVTGARPFGGSTSADVGSAILRDTPVPVRNVRADAPNDLERVIARCLEKDRERRIQTAKDVRNELELLRRGAPAAAPTRPAPARTPVSDAPSIAVLPFANRSRDEEDEYFSDGLADELTSVLSKIRGLRVAARSSSATFKGKPATVAEVGKALNVATVLEGSVRKAGNRVRISVQLVKVEDGYQLWSETYDRTLDDIFAVQDDIAQSVVRELRTALLGAQADSKASGEVRAEVAAAAVGRGASSEAHRLCMQARHLIDRLNETDTVLGIRYLRDALALDPDYALAWVYLSAALNNQAGYGWVPMEEGLPPAREAALRALSLAPDLAEAHAALGRIQSSFDWDWKGAEASYRRALELAPTHSDILVGAANLAFYHGREEEGEALLRRALEHDPLSALAYVRLGFTCRAGDRPAEAIECFTKALELAPRRIVSHFMLGVIHMAERREREALIEMNLEPAEWARLTGLAVIHHLAGRKAESDEALDRLGRQHGKDSAYQIAAVHSVRGETDACFEWLERAYAQRDGGLPFLMREPFFRPVRTDPRWAAFLKKMGLAG